MMQKGCVMFSLPKSVVWTEIYWKMNNSTKYVMSTLVGQQKQELTLKLLFSPATLAQKHMTYAKTFKYDIKATEQSLPPSFWFEQTHLHCVTLQRVNGNIWCVK